VDVYGSRKHNEMYYVELRNVVSVCNCVFIYSYILIVYLIYDLLILSMYVYVSNCMLLVCVNDRLSQQDAKECNLYLALGYYIVEDCTPYL